MNLLGHQRRIHTALRHQSLVAALLGHPARPFFAVMGGAKVSDKIAFINALLQKVDHLLIGGKMAYAFLKAIGVDVGRTKVDDAEVAAAKGLATQIGAKIELPMDCLAANSDDLADVKVVSGPIPPGYEGVDIGPKTIDIYGQKLAEANPLHHTVQLVRGAAFGWAGWTDLLRVGYLAAVGFVLWRLAIISMQRKLID